MDIASEYRYRNPVIGPGDLVIGISQSGETADTLAAMRLARERGATVLALTNGMGSQATRDADGVLFTRSGLEIGVAATKTFVAQVAAMYLLALRIAELRGTLAPERAARAGRRRSSASRTASRSCSAAVEEAVERTAQAHHAQGLLPLPRPPRRPAGGARGRAQAQGDLLHRHRRLRGGRDEARPDRAARRAARRSSCVATDSPVLEKVVSNMQEVRARGAHVIAVATEGNRTSARTPRRSCGCRETDWMLQPLLAVIPLQLLAYRIARLRGLNVDQPRNLAKTVTVE